MSDIRREKTLVSQLDVGMFVCDLDRSWLGTPFLLEGLLIESEAEIATLKKICTFVYIDHTMSVGDYYIAPAKSEKHLPDDRVSYQKTANPDNATNKKPLQKQRASEPTPTFSFLEVLKEIKASNQNTSVLNQKNSQSSLDLNIKHEITAKAIANQQQEEASASIATYIKSDLTQLIQSVKHWSIKRKNKPTKTQGDTEILGSAKKIDKHQANNPLIIYDDTSPPVEDEITRIGPIYAQSQQATQAVFEALALEQEIDLSTINESLSSMVESIERCPDALFWLSKLKQSDNYAYQHAMNVSITLMAFAHFISLSRKDIKDLGLAGLLQDIGKAKLPAELLKKEDELNPSEFELMKKHVDYALSLLEHTDNISNKVILTVSQHHERADGSGYPFQLKYNQISIMGQMAGLIDTYCAMTSNKVYANSVHNQAALEELNSLRDVKFTGTLIDQLIQFLGMYPVGTLVELNSGEVGIVIQQNNVRRLKPRVMILLNADKVRNEAPATINLINNPPAPNGEPYLIVKSLPPNSFGLNLDDFYS
ncbi:MAG: DUF3391 domain-containing protein [Methylotenera sp.]|nr:DUF3391 domain-containing protein [Methylotenera sp.]